MGSNFGLKPARALVISDAPALQRILMQKKKKKKKKERKKEKEKTYWERYGDARRGSTLASEQMGLVNGNSSSHSAPADWETGCKAGAWEPWTECSSRHEDSLLTALTMQSPAVICHQLWWQLRGLKTNKQTDPMLILYASRCRPVWIQRYVGRISSSSLAVQRQREWEREREKKHAIFFFFFPPLPLSNKPFCASYA